MIAEQYIAERTREVWDSVRGLPTRRGPVSGSQFLSRGTAGVADVPVVVDPPADPPADPPEDPPEEPAFELDDLDDLWARHDADVRSSVSLNYQGPYWPVNRAEEHKRGLDFATGDYVTIGGGTYGDDPMWTNSATPAIAVSFLVIPDATAGTRTLYGEGDAGVNATGISINCVAGVMRWNITENGIAANNTIGLTQDGDWHIITLILATSGWSAVVDGVLTVDDAAWAVAPGTGGASGVDTSMIGGLRTHVFSATQVTPVGYAMRHAAVLTTAQARQVQQYIADKAATDGIDITISGSEVANSNSPQDEWAMDEDTGTSLANLARPGISEGTLKVNTLWNKERHSRGLDCNGVSHIELGNTALYGDPTEVHHSYSFLFYHDSDENTTTATIYNEGHTSSNNRWVLFRARSGNALRIDIKDDAGVATISGGTVTTLTDKAWNLVTLVLDAAGTGWGLVVNGDEDIAFGTAYANPPGTTTLNSAKIGGWSNGVVNPTELFRTPVAYCLRHNVALSLAQCRQVQQYMADEAAADVGVLTVTGSEVANSNTPQDEWAFDENEDGAEIANSGTASTVGERLPADTGTQLDDLGPNGYDYTQSTEADQPKYFSAAFGHNGRACFRGDGANTYMLRTTGLPDGTTVGKPFTVFAAGKIDADSGTSMALWSAGKHSAGNNYVVGRLLSGSGNAQLVERNSVSSVTADIVVDYLDAAAHVMEVVFASDVSRTLAMDGANDDEDTTSKNAFNANVSQVRIMDIAANVDQVWSGPYCESVEIAGLLSAGLRTSVIDLLSSKWVA